MQWPWSPHSYALTVYDLELAKKIPLVNNYDWSFVLGNTAANPQSRAPRSHARLLERALNRNIDVLFIGDSITSRWGSDGKEAWNREFAPLNAENFGIGEDRTQHVLWRLAHGELTGLRPKAVVLMIGTNNLGRNTVEEISEGVEMILARILLECSETRVLLVGVLPRLTSHESRAVLEKIVRLNQSLACLGRLNKNITFFDASTRFVFADGAPKRELMPDGVHLSPQGYDVLAAAIKPKLCEIVQRQTN